MKSIKKTKGYGALEYSITVGLVFVIAIIVFNVVKGKEASSVSLIDKSNLAANKEVEEVSASTEDLIAKEVSVVFPDPVPKINIVGDIITNKEVTDYLTTNNIVIKNSKEEVITDYEIINPTKVGSLVQFDIVSTDDEKKRVQVSSLYSPSDEALINKILGDGFGRFTDESYKWVIKNHPIIFSVSSNEYIFAFPDAATYKYLTPETPFGWGVAKYYNYPSGELQPPAWYRWTGYSYNSYGTYVKKAGTFVSCSSSVLSLQNVSKILYAKGNVNYRHWGTDKDGQTFFPIPN